jgi:hypothetical protein
MRHLEPLLALAAADDLADAGGEHVHGRDGPAVVVLAHVERLDVLRVVHDDDRPADVLLGEPALVLGLQVDAPLHRELELLLRLLEEANGLGVVEPLEGGRDDALELLHHALLDALVEERHVVGALGEHRLQHVLQQSLGQVGVV